MLALHNVCILQIPGVLVISGQPPLPKQGGSSVVTTNDVSSDDSKTRSDAGDPQKAAPSAGAPPGRPVTPLAPPPTMVAVGAAGFRRIADPPDNRPAPLGLGALSPDRWLHERLVGRDPHALAEAHRRFHSVVFGVAIRLTGDRQMAEDVAQDVFLALWRRPECFDPGRGSIRPWLATMARCRAIDALRVEDAVRRRIDREGARRSDHVADIGETVEALLSAENLRVALNDLDEDRRRPIMLAYFSGRTYRQVAQDLGVAEGTIKSRIRAGLRQLADSLAAEMIGEAC